jgi:hypothetical protein
LDKNESLIILYFSYDSHVSHPLPPFSPQI